MIGTKIWIPQASDGFELLYLLSEILTYVKKKIKIILCIAKIAVNNCDAEIIIYMY